MSRQATIRTAFPVLAETAQILGSHRLRFRLEITNTLDVLNATREKRLAENAFQLQQHFESFGRRLSEFSKTNPEGASRTGAELSATLKDFKDSL
jgi:hypothetical protein